MHDNVQLLTLTHGSLHACYATSCTSSACRAMEQPSHYPVPVPPGYASRSHPVPDGIQKSESGTSLMNKSSRMQITNHLAINQSHTRLQVQRQLVQITPQNVGFTVHT